METHSEYKRIYILPANEESLVATVHIANGSLTIVNQPDVPRNITIIVYQAGIITTGLITVTGTNFNGETITESIDLSVTSVLTGTKTFRTILSCVVSNLTGEDPADVILIGYGENVQIQEGRCLFHNLTVNGGSGTTGYYKIIDGISGTTANVGTLKVGIAPKTYTYDVLMATGLRIIIAGDETITATYRIN